MPRALIALLDGAADQPIPELGYKTPLEAAQTPFMDGVASSGVLGCTGWFLHTHEFLLSFLAEGEVARGVLEAYALGLELERGMVVYRLSPARMSGGSIRLEYGLRWGEVCDLINHAKSSLKILEGLRPSIYFYDYRGLLILRRVAFRVSQTSPFDGDPLNLPRVLREFVELVALESGGLTLLPWGGGVVGEPMVKSRVQGISIISNSLPVLGLAKLIGVKVYEIRGLYEIPELAGKILRRNHLLIHFERPDEESHKKSYRGKVSSIEEIDGVLAETYEKARPMMIAVTIDHASSSITGMHFRAMTPFAYSSKSSGNVSRKFCEREASVFMPPDSLLEVMLDGC